MPHPADACIVHIVGIQRTHIARGVVQELLSHVAGRPFKQARRTDPLFIQAVQCLPRHYARCGEIGRKADVCRLHARVKSEIGDAVLGSGHGAVPLQPVHRTPHVGPLHTGPVAARYVLSDR